MHNCKLIFKIDVSVSTYLSFLSLNNFSKLLKQLYLFHKMFSTMYFYKIQNRDKFYAIF